MLFVEIPSMCSVLYASLELITFRMCKHLACWCSTLLFSYPFAFFSHKPHWSLWVMLASLLAASGYTVYENYYMMIWCICYRKISSAMWDKILSEFLSYMMLLLLRMVSLIDSWDFFVGCLRTYCSFLSTDDTGIFLFKLRALMVKEKQP